MRDDEESLVREGLDLAETVAKKMYHRLGGVIEQAELVGIARPVVLEVARDHDPARAPFAAYLVMKMKWAMLTELRRHVRRGQIARRAAACIALDRVIDASEADVEAREVLGTDVEYQADLSQFLAVRAAAMAMGLSSVPDGPAGSGNRETPEDRLQLSEMRADVRRAVGRLPDKQRALVERHYFGGEAFDEIAGDLGISKSWASRQHAQALASLATMLADPGSPDRSAAQPGA